MQLHDACKQMKTGGFSTLTGGVSAVAGLSTQGRRASASGVTKT